MIDMKKFCDPDDHQMISRTPFILPNGNVCATNMEIMVIATPKNVVHPEQYETTDNWKVESWTGSFIENDLFSGLNISNWTKPELVVHDCDCGGYRQGVEERCGCDGKSFCPICSEGIIWEPCQCFQAGETEWMGRRIAISYQAAISELPDVEIAGFIGDEDYAEPVFFKSSLAWGSVVPMSDL